MSKALEKKSLKLLEKKRSMTATAQSRWYRAPEVIVCDVNYNQSADIWSLGCIISELIKFTKPYTEIDNPFEKNILFFGTSCYPLSPIKVDKEIHNGMGKDQRMIDLDD